MIDAVVGAGQDIEIKGPSRPEWNSVLTADALQFVARLHREFNPRREELLARRQERKKRLDAGGLPDFLPETRQIRDAEWRVAPVPADLEDRRVEITGPV